VIEQGGKKKKSRLGQAFESSKHLTLKDLETKALLNSLAPPVYDNNNKKWLMNRRGNNSK
jgi:hypothetical protein